MSLTLGSASRQTKLSQVCRGIFTKKLRVYEESHRESTVVGNSAWKDNAEQYG